MEDKVTAMVMAAFAADSLALGIHWIYDPRQIAADFGRIESLRAPGPRSYHKNREKGDFTHYGDQMLVLLESLAAKGRFDPVDFSQRWRKLFDGYDGYIDGATRNTLANYEKGRAPENAGSTSDDLAGAARIAPLVCLLQDDPEALARNARIQTQMTHTDPATVDAAEYLALVTQAVIKGTSPVAAMKQVAEARFDISPISAWLQKGLASLNQDSVEVINNFGSSCHTGEMFPGVVHLIARYENSLREGLIQCMMAGGDNAARGALVGMILGAHLGMSQVPREWVAGLKARAEIENLLKKIT
jgi:ADP-ribosylglycohydrolase